jgi:hydrogen peroxide-dependent heme synthase
MGDMSDAVYAYYPVFRRTAALDDRDVAFFEAQADEIAALLDKYSDRVSVRGTYVATGFRPDADLLFWWTAPSADDHQELLLELRRTDLGRALELTHAFLGVTRPAEFNPDHLPAFLRGEAPRKYLSVYPFVRTEDWYLLPAEERSKLLGDHGRMGREFPQVLPNTTSAFGLGDWEWILAFEADDLTFIVDCIRRLREAEARRYTKLDIPFVVGIRGELNEAIKSLA